VQVQLRDLAYSEDRWIIEQMTDLNGAVVGKIAGIGLPIN
jgi:hypothetical protein